MDWGWHGRATIAISTVFGIGIVIGATVVWAAVVVRMLYAIPGLCHTCVFWGVKKKDKFVTLGMGDTTSVVRTWSFVRESAYRSGPELEIEEL
jgi:hypothetical protein